MDEPLVIMRPVAGEYRNGDECPIESSETIYPDDPRYPELKAAYESFLTRAADAVCNDLERGDA